MAAHMSACSTSYPACSNPYIRGKLPPVKSQRYMKMCAGRVLIFLIIGILLFVLGLISVGVYLNVNSVTSSSQYTEVMPLYVTSGAVIVAGVFVSFLFWKRFKVLVFLTVAVCVASGFLCGTTAVLMCTHILQPLQTFTSCRYYLSQKLCQCLCPYRRDVLSLHYSETDLTKYDFEEVTSCDAVEQTLPQLLYALVGVYGLVLLLCIGSAVLALLVLRAERIKHRFLGDDSYEEVYTVSGSSSQDQSDTEPEVTTLPQGQTIVVQNSVPANSGNTVQPQRSSRENSVSLSLNSASGSNRVGPLKSQNTQSVPTSAVQGQRSRTPGPNDLGKENLANKYKINKLPDRDIPLRQRLSKTPDREIGSGRRYSFSASRRLSKSCESLDSSGNGSRELNADSELSEGKTKGKLREHRRKGKRAATIHTLDTDQLLLILNLQMRYLQESRQQQTDNPNVTSVAKTGTGGSRRAITPQPVSQRQVIPQKVRSHTPQPRRANQRAGDQRSNVNFSQVKWNLGTSSRGGNISNSENSSRRTSESSDKTGDFLTGIIPSLYQKSGYSVAEESYLHSQQMCKTIPNIRHGYNPYIHTQFQNSSADNVHFVTYSDSMLDNIPNKPKSRSSVQADFLPPQPLQRGSQSQNQLPSQPLSRRINHPRPLPPQPVHRGSSAFHIVDRNKSRSPSVSSDKGTEGIIATPKRKTRKDYAELAVRENFTMNARPFILKDASESSNSSAMQNRHFGNNDQTDVENINFVLRREKNRTPENLPPYSGPPSYKEHVSSCNTSVTSSVSSNPEDIYTLPKQRVQTEPILPSQSLHICPGSKESSAPNSASFYGSSGVALNSKNVLSNVDIHVRVKDEEDAGVEDALYSAPAKSKVKQFIVPEDYYTQVSKVRRSDHTYENQSGENTVTGIYNMMGKEEDVFGNYTSANEAVYNKSYPASSSVGSKAFLPDTVYRNTQTVVKSGHVKSDVDAKRDVTETLYRNIQSVIKSGLQFSFNPGADGQIAPDAKYNEYEDVYDVPESVPDILPQQTASVQPAYSVNTHGIPSVPHRTKSKSAKKNKSPYPVSNVHVSNNMLDSVLGDTGRLMQQSMESVENVHAKNVSKIPRIKLNDLEMHSADVEDDDEVFLEDTKNRLNTKSTSLNKKVQKQVQDVGLDQDYQEILDIELTNENQESDHMIFDLTNEENETGYMKMSLPEKGGRVPDISQYMKTTQKPVQMSSQCEERSAVTTVTSEHSRRVPDGNDNESVPESEDYQETGV